MAVLPLSFTAKLVSIETLLDLREDTSRTISEYWIRRLHSGSFHAISGDILCQIIQDYPKRLQNELLVALVPPHWRGICLKECINISAEGLVQVLKKCEKLERLDLSLCSQLVTEPLFKLFSKAKLALNALILDDTPVTDNIVWTILKTQRQLQELSLSGCDNITDNVFLLNNAKQLLRENSVKCNTVDSKDFQCGLTTVNLSGCQQITSTAVRHLASLCGPSLRKLNVSYTKCDCTSLWYLCGYTLTTVVKLSQQVKNKLNEKEKNIKICWDDSSSSGQGGGLSVSGHADTGIKLIGQSAKQLDSPKTESELKEELSLKDIDLSFPKDITPSGQDANKKSSPKNIPNSAPKVHFAAQLVEKVHEPEGVKVTDSSLPQPVDQPKLRRTSSTKDTEQLLQESVNTFQQKVRSLNPLKRSRDCPSYEDFAAELSPPSLKNISFADEAKFQEPLSHSVDDSQPANLTTSHDTEDEPSAVSLPSAATVDSAVSISDENMSSLEQIKLDQAQGSSEIGSTSELAVTNVDGEIFVYPKNAEDAVTNALHIAPAHSSNYSVDDSVISESQVGCCDSPFLNEEELIEMLNFEKEAHRDDPETFVPLDNNQNLYKLYDPSTSAGYNVTVETQTSDTVKEQQAMDSLKEEKLVTQNDQLVKQRYSSPTNCDMIPPPSSQSLLDTPAEPLAESTGNSKSFTQEEYKRLFESNITSLDITGIDLLSKDLAKRAIEDFCRSNRNVERFLLHWKSLNDNMLKPVIEYLENLKVLSAVNCELLTSESLAELGLKCKNLEELILHGVCFISDAALLPAIVNHKLKHLNLAETEITDHTLKMIAKNSEKIQHLKLSWCEEITDDGVKELVNSCVDLRTLKLRQIKLQEETLVMLARNCCNIQELDLSTVTCMTDIVLETMAANLHYLRKLDISWNSAVTDAGVTALFKQCYRLKHLNLAGVKQLTSKPFVAIIADIQRWKKFQALLRFKYQEQQQLAEMDEPHLSSDEEYEDMYLARRSTCYAPSLRYLDVEYCDQLNDRQLAELVAVCRGTLAIRDYYGQMIEPKYMSCLKGKLSLQQNYFQ